MISSYLGGLLCTASEHSAFPAVSAKVRPSKLAFPTTVLTLEDP